jgi:tRNA pseudouridine55 synthase
MNDYSLNSLKEGQILLIDKPLRWTSFDVVNKVRCLIKKTYNIKKIKVGHAGTLDPLASGLLILCTGKMTKNIEQLMGKEKTYKAKICFGATTPSYDLEREIDATYPADHINESKILEILPDFTGNIQQIPPMHSAVKKDGKRLYEYARNNEITNVPSRQVSIHQLDILEFNHPCLKLQISCSKGTYIRSLANDLGKALASGAHLAGLERLKIGEYHVQNAMSIPEFQAHLENAQD